LLHRLIYPIAILAILHFWWMRAGKNNLGDPLLFGAVIALLLGYRLVCRWREHQASHQPG
jgi:sulfoxide reductase heme-binding subunit YedZ